LRSFGFLELLFWCFSIFPFLPPIGPVATPVSVRRGKDRGGDCSSPTVAGLVLYYTKAGRSLRERWYLLWRVGDLPRVARVLNF